LHIDCLFGIRLKSKDTDENKKRIEIIKAEYSFLHNLEYYLAEKKETGIIIADVIKNEKCETNTRHRSVLETLLYQRMAWRINPKADFVPLIASKYKFESRACFLLDNIHYVESKDSIFLEISDIIIYIIMRVFTYLYLQIKPEIIKADISKVPISTDTFRSFILNNATFTCCESLKNDVAFISGSNLLFIVKKTEFINLRFFKEVFISSNSK